jgi:hypothetical protein
VDSINRVISHLGSDFLIGAGVGALVATFVSSKLEEKEK